jgi:hypothetical protein
MNEEYLISKTFNSDYLFLSLTYLDYQTLSIDYPTLGMLPNIITCDFNCSFIS